MIILIDYDNVNDSERNKGLRNLMERIILKLSSNNILNTLRIKVRLYGGWYESNVLSRKGQYLITEIKSNFPDTIKTLDGKKVIINVELASSLEIEPNIFLYHTYRSNQVTFYGYRCQDPINAGCCEPQCPLKYVFEFINNKKCPNNNCAIKPQDIISKNEQKLVDTMFITDIIYHSNIKQYSICIVSSDDDLWPGIRTAILSGAEVIHLHTRSNFTSRYNKIPHTNYKVFSLV